MQQELPALDIANLPQLEQAAEEVRETKKPRRIVRGNEELAILHPAKKPRRTRLPGRPTAADDALWELIGMGHSGRHDISANKQHTSSRPSTSLPNDRAACSLPSSGLSRQLGDVCAHGRRR